MDKTTQLRESALAAKERNRFRLTLALIIVAAFVLSMLAGWLGLVKPSAATLSNGGFCIVAKGYDGEFTGKAGAKNCGSVEETTPPVVVPQPNLALASCVTNRDALGRYTGFIMTWTSDQTHSSISAKIGDHPIHNAAITMTGPVSGVYTYHLNLSSTATTDLMGAGAFSAPVRVDAANAGGVSYGAYNLTVSANGFNPSCSRA